MHTETETYCMIKEQTKKWNKPAKFFCVTRLALLYDVDEVVCEDKWYTLPLDAKLGLEVAKDMAEVYVEELTGRNESQTVSIMDTGKAD